MEEIETIELNNSHPNQFPESLKTPDTAPSYILDLKQTLEFDRKCRSLEAVFEDVYKRVHDLEDQIADIKSKHESLKK